MSCLHDVCPEMEGQQVMLGECRVEDKSEGQEPLNKEVNRYVPPHTRIHNSHNIYRLLHLFKETNFLKLKKV